jgi:4-hydroxy-2-oxoheptanedioate aldolase
MIVLEGIYVGVGPAQLTLGLGPGRLTPGFDRGRSEMIAALPQIVAVGKANGVCAALHCGTPENASRAIAWGLNMTTVSGDSRLPAGAAGASVAKFRGLVGQGAAKSASDAH